MKLRLQRTISRCVETSGVGFFTGADVTLRFLPAPPGHGIAFERTDCPGSALIPARIEYAVTRSRRTAIEHAGHSVEMIEHVMAALAGLQVDNCLVQLDAPEPPGHDGSARILAERLLEAGIVQQNQRRECLVLDTPAQVRDDGAKAEIVARPVGRRVYALSYHLNYGERAVIRPQTYTVEITPETFLDRIAFARTFVLEEEVEELRACGIGLRHSPRDLLVFGSHGPIDNTLRTPDECARHKILDCLGDFALIGCDLQGHISAYRSGHRLNREMVRRLATMRHLGGEQPSKFAA